MSKRHGRLRPSELVPYAFIAGGGTGGHVYPAIAIADALVARGHAKESIEFVGSARGIEATVVPKAGYEITLLPGRGIKRSLSVDNVGAVIGLAVALVRAVALVARHRPRVVVSVGGYAGAPCAVAAAVLRVPLVLAESNAVPGAANRLVAKFATASAVAFAGTPLPRASVTGNPVRPEIGAIDRAPEARRAAKERLGLPADRIVVAAFGGSLGARTINRAAAELSRSWLTRDDVALYHVVGRRDWHDKSLKASSDGSLTVKTVEYEEQMAVLYAAADIVVCRSGATTSAEIAVAGVPSILVPLPNAPGDHQTANARALQDAGAAVLVPDNQCNGMRLAEVLQPLVADSARLESMGAAAKSLGMPDAADRVAAVVESAAR